MSMTPSTPSSLPEISGRYRIVQRLGAGSMGAVFLAEDGILRRRVALKLLRAERIGHEGLEQLQREFLAFAELRHPRIAEAYDFGYTHEHRLPFYTREHVDGEPLRPGPPHGEEHLGPRAYLEPVLHCLEALEHLHAHGVAHLDLHAGNLIQAREPRRGSVLIDFGLPLLALGARRPPSMDRSGGATPPQRAAPGDPRGAAEAADLHAAGRLLLWRLTGRSEGDARLSREVPGWSARLTLALERILEKALHQDPARRFAGARAMREALSRALGDGAEASSAVEPREVTIGRRRELERVDRTLDEAQAGGVAMLWLHGRPGLGKTRLLTEARWRAQTRGFDVAEVPRLQGGARRASLAAALESAAGDRAGAAAWRAALRAEHGGSTRERSRRAALAFRASEGHPSAIIIDDAVLEGPRALDRESRAFLEALAAMVPAADSSSSAGRGLALLVASSDPPPPGPDGLPPPSCVLCLKPLTAAPAQRLLDAALRPLEAGRPLLARLVEPLAGSPRRILRAARLLREAWGRAGRIPGDLDVGHFAREASSGGRAGAALRGPAPDLRVARLLAIVERPALAAEIQAGTGLSAEEVRAALARLEADEAVISERAGGRRLYGLGDRKEAARLSRESSRKEARRVHALMEARLAKVPRPRPAEVEQLARHRLRAWGRRAMPAVLEAAHRLEESEHGPAAVGLLQEALALEPEPLRRLPIAEALSALLESAGDHVEALQALQPIHDATRGRLARGDALRLLRRLGVHHHRAGQHEAALKRLAAGRSLAAPGSDHEELALIESELAELHTLRGEYTEADEACRRGLAHLEEARRKAGGSGRGPRRRALERLEVTLRASAGHLELRRLRHAEAREHLVAAASLAARVGRTGLRALILNNLGIVHNQLGAFTEARAAFEEARALLLKAGDRRAVLQIASNLALIAAKLGEEAEARRQLAQAREVLHQHPEARLELSAAHAAATVALYLGDAPAALESFDTALALGRRLGDAHLVRFGEVFRAEALLLCGRYQEALAQLRATERHAATHGPPLLRRMTCARLALLQELLGMRRGAAASLARFEAEGCTGMELLEAWNDVFAALAAPRLAFAGEDRLRAAARTFEGLSVRAGARTILVLRLLQARVSGDLSQLREALLAMPGEPLPGHRLLAVLEPLARAEARIALGEGEDEARAALEDAASAAVGQPFLELEVRVEALRALQAEASGDLDLARKLLHRALHTRELLARLAPASRRDALRRHPRFRDLEALAARLPGPERPLERPRPRTIPEAHGMVGASLALRRVLEAVERLADEPVPVLITGETGTGKELVARALHAASRRAAGPFLAIHCPSLPRELLESELFGHAAGAFTGADEERRGLLEHASGGTLLLDDITGLPRESQAKLLRAIESRQVRPIGSMSARPFDVRLLSSAGSDLDASLRSGALRNDLYYRLRGVELHVPPLRARTEDIPALARHFLERHARRSGRPPQGLSPAAIELLLAHDWPGNVRELETVLLRAALLSSPGAQLGPASFRDLMARRDPSSLFPNDLLAGRSLPELKRGLERAYLSRLFEETGGDLDAMCKALGVRRVSLYIWLRRVGLDVRSMRRGLHGQ